MGKVNDYLNKSIAHSGKMCVMCHRTYPETMLNIEGHIHHGGDIVCLDTKSCNRTRRKLSSREVV